MLHSLVFDVEGKFAMWGFLATVLGAFIGASLAPFIINFFSERQHRINKLREAYVLSDKLFDYFNLLHSYNQQIISLGRDETNYSKGLGEAFETGYPSDNPLSELMVLLNFDLNYPETEANKLALACCELICLKAMLWSYFLQNQHAALGNVENNDNNKELLNNIMLSRGEIQKWCKDEREQLKIGKILCRLCNKIKSTCVRSNIT